MNFNHPLAGPRLALVPLCVETDAAVLYDLFQKNPGLFLYLPFALPDNALAYQSFLESLKDTQRLYTVRLKEHPDQIIGMIGYLSFRLEIHKSIEIGHILIGTDWQNQGLGVEAGKILLKYALECGMYRVEWKCHHENIASQKTATKIGFTYEGTFRNHIYMKNHHRHSKYYSVICQEKDLWLSTCQV
ncbi:hypothetical protein HDU91_001581 [Kappamyces sp. JEL0680]|nr:hypothetical protein HDU91_001581 [Kappamyces sp. JEL0680]